jgi:hypothetical protein
MFNNERSHATGLCASAMMQSQLFFSEDSDRKFHYTSTVHRQSSELHQSSARRNRRDQIASGLRDA